MLVDQLEVAEAYLSGSIDCYRSAAQGSNLRAESIFRSQNDHCCNSKDSINQNQVHQPSALIKGVISSRPKDLT